MNPVFFFHYSTQRYRHSNLVKSTLNLDLASKPKCRYVSGVRLIDLAPDIQHMAVSLVTAGYDLNGFMTLRALSLLGQFFWMYSSQREMLLFQVIQSNQSNRQEIPGP